MRSNYVIMDIYSRKAVHWEIWPTETGALAREFIEHAIAANDGARPNGARCRAQAGLRFSY
jgi:hypothetical protein